MSDALDLGIAAKVAEWRRQALDNTLSTEDLAAWIKHVREGRVAASIASAKSKAKRAPPNLAAMMDELDNI